MFWSLKRNVSEWRQRRRERRHLPVRYKQKLKGRKWVEKQRRGRRRRIPDYKENILQTIPACTSNPF